MASICRVQIGSSSKYLHYGRLNKQENVFAFYRPAHILNKLPIETYKLYLNDFYWPKTFYVKIWINLNKFIEHIIDGSTLAFCYKIVRINYLLQCVSIFIITSHQLFFMYTLTCSVLSICTKYTRTRIIYKIKHTC